MQHTDEPVGPLSQDQSSQALTPPTSDGTSRPPCKVGGNPDQRLSCTIVATPHDGAEIIALRGELDSLTAPQLCAAIANAMNKGCQTIVLDLSELPYVGACGVRAMVDCATTLRLRGGTLAIHEPSPWVTHVLSTTGLGRLLDSEGLTTG